ncbi:hypothetical protein RJ639_021295 [Escallonia herrerae]|uniref:Protein kinase domain-containing protein n=1 Tax=Escallonia herrerae TaxID=1293975 RepID=A0AA89AGD2_9ASTE|nr:hypothetical protein RJ639_021295 [Escallonia herrerae]
MTKLRGKLSCSFNSLVFLIHLFECSSQKTCPNCGAIEVPYPLSTNPDCGDLDYSLRCDPHSQKLYFDALNGSYYQVLKIEASLQRMVVQPSPWLPGTCVTQDMPASEGLWLNQTLPFNITSSNTIFLFNCSPRLLVSPLNCTPASLCHRYLESSGHVDAKRALECASGLEPCCTFVAGGMPSAYKIRLHNSGCRAFRSILDLDHKKPASQWEEGLEIQWASPPEPACKSQSDCSGASKCSPAGKGNVFRCLCDRNYYWDHGLGICSKKNSSSKARLTLKVSIGVVSFLVLAVVVAAIRVQKSCLFSNQSKLAKAREQMFKSSNGWKSARMFSLKEVKKATNGFSRDRILGIGGFGEVYKGELPDGTIVAVKSAKVAYTPIYHRDVKSTNILLDDDLNAKVADFGLSRLASPGLSHVSTCAQGTLGYLDPEYYRNYQLTDKSDVYSYGVVLLEVLTSKKAIDFSREEDDVNLAIYVSQRAKNGLIMEVVDQHLLGGEPSAPTVTSVRLFSELALACLREKKGDRPNMKDVVQELQSITEIINQKMAPNEASVEIKQS